MARSAYLLCMLVAAAAFAVVDVSASRTLLQKPKPKPTCVSIDIAKQKNKLCAAQTVFIKGAKKSQVITPVTVADVFLAADAACVALSGKFAFADPAGIAWGGAAGKCFNGAKYTTGTTWTKLKCCETGATASSLARARETAAEMGLTQGTLDLARARETAAEIGTTQGQLDTPQAAGSGLARARDTAAESGVTEGTWDTPNPQSG